MEERNCKDCIYANWKSEYDNGCTKWDCEYVNKKEVAKKLVFCKECKHYKIHEWSEGEFMACHNICGAVAPRDPEDFCSRGEKE